VQVLLITADGTQRRSLDELDALLADARAGRGLIWIDVPLWDDDAAAVLTERFGIHPRAAGDCAKRNPVPKVHVYRDHQFVVLHGPEREFYQARTNTKMTIAAERLAVIAAVTLPVTALSSIVGMNVIVDESTHLEWPVLLLGVMAALSITMLVWARRQGWW
jgi:Mg2+ and Co2+ transporter CorA